MSDLNPFNSTLALSHRFGVYFFESGFVPTGLIMGPTLNLDCRFQRVSGIGAEVEIKTFREGGVLHNRRLPTRVKYPNLVLDRGIVTSISLLSVNISMALASMSLSPCNILIILFDEQEHHIMHRIFRNAIPVKWTLGDMDADSNQVMIERIELSYEKMLTIPFAFTGYNIIKDAIT